MEFLSALALVLLTLVGYASGAVLAGRGKQVTPGLLDIILILALWAAALATRGALGRWLAIVVWLAMGLGAGALATGLRRGRYPAEPAAARQPPVHSGRQPVKAGWEAWKAFSRRMGNYQSRVWLALFYFVVVTPFGLAMRLFSDPLRAKHRGADTAWSDWEQTDEGLEAARRQF